MAEESTPRRPRGSRSKHWRHRIYVAATMAAGSLLIAAQAALAGDKYHW